MGAKNPQQPHQNPLRERLGPMMNGSLGMLSNEEAAKAMENRRQPRQNPLMEMLGPMMNGSLGMLTNEEAAAMRAQPRPRQGDEFRQRLQAMFPGFAAKFGGAQPGASPVPVNGTAVPQVQDPRAAIIQSLMSGITRMGQASGGGYNNG